MIQLDAQFFKTWRPKYCWPPGKTRRYSEDKIRCLEDLVRNNILKSGPKTRKEVLSEIVDWKTEGKFKRRRVESFQNNKDADVENSVKEILRQLKDDPDKVSCSMELLCTLEGVGPAIASAFLRFLDPINHRYGIIDINVARVLNEQGITDFKFDYQDRYIPYDNHNRDQYQKYHKWLKDKAKDLEGTTYKDIDDKQQPFKPVDIEMAIFAYTRYKRLKRTKECSD